jgi:glycerophosphoryl diester phosphodiesterase
MVKLIRSIYEWFAALFHSCPKPVRKPERDEVFLVVAHRGSPTVKVENTIESFEHAIEVDGANALELDLCLTRDGVLVIWHDWDPDGSEAKLREKGLEPDVKYRPKPPEEGEFRKPVSRLSLDEFIRHFGYASKEGDERVDSPITFDEFVRWAATKEKLQLVFLDTKIPDEEAGLVRHYIDSVEEVMERYGARFRIVFETVECEVLRAMKEYRPHHDYALDVVLHSGFVFDIEGGSCARQAIDHRNRYATPERPRQNTVAPWTTYRRLVEHDLKLCDTHNRSNPDHCIEALVCFTVNDAKEMRCLISMGVQGIQSDRPGLLRSVADRMGRRVDGAEVRPKPEADGVDGQARQKEREAIARR